MTVANKPNWMLTSLERYEAAFRSFMRCGEFLALDDPRTPAEGNIRVDRTALRHLLLEVQDLRARQGVDWTWTDGLHPTLARELDAAIRDEDSG